MAANKIEGDLQVSGSVSAGGGFTGLSRSNLVTQTLVPYAIPATDWRTHDALGALLPTTPAADDLGIYGVGTVGTVWPYIWSGDVKTLNSTRFASTLFKLPAEYVAGQAARVRLRAGMRTNPASSACTLTVAVYRHNGDGAVSGSNLYAGSAIDINTVGISDRDFDLSAGLLSPGDELFIRAAIAFNDAATATEVAALITQTKLLLSIR